MIVIEALNLKKEFQLSSKEAKLRNTTSIKAVDDISFKVEKGTIYALLGPNGAGKTTTLRMLSTLMKPDSGTIEIDNSFDENVIRSKIAFLTSDLLLDRNFTPSYLFDYFSTLYGIKNNPRKSELFDFFGITPFKDSKIAKLSTGMKQKVAIAISLVHNPDILIYDEPTNGLDIVLSRDIEQYLLKQKEEGKTIIISTHILDIVNKLADNIGIINQGHLIYDGTKNDLLLKYDNLEEAFFKIIGGEEK